MKKYLIAGKYNFTEFGKSSVRVPINDFDIIITPISKTKIRICFDLHDLETEEVCRYGFVVSTGTNTVKFGSYGIFRIETIINDNESGTGKTMVVVIKERRPFVWFCGRIINRLRRKKHITLIPTKKEDLN